MKYQVVRNSKYDYTGQSYSTLFPNLHKYPATMLPQIGVDILNDFGINNGRMLDPYCGSGSSFTSGLEYGLTEMYGYDLNPLAILITSVKFTKISPELLLKRKDELREKVYEFLKKENNFDVLTIPRVTNIDYWFSKQVVEKLSLLRYFINEISNVKIRQFFSLPFSETVRECSFTRNSEFKLFRMKTDDILNFNPDVVGVYFNKLNETITNYSNHYYPLLEKKTNVQLNLSELKPKKEFYDIILTSPPYGDSRTTVAYGQFSALSNEWLGIDSARKVDGKLMGGTKVKNIMNDSCISDYLQDIASIDNDRALEVSSFYFDLHYSISKVAFSTSKNGIAIYVVGNRTVKNIQLPTDQFIAECFEKNGFQHIITYERLLGNKVMPLRNSPSNVSGKTASTMLNEYIVVCKKL